MTDLDWFAASVGVSAAAIAALITVAHVMRRRRRRQTISRASAVGDRRIEIVAIDERKWKR